MREYVLVSAFVTNPDKLKHLEKQWKKRDKEHKKYFGRGRKQVKEINPKDFGGEVILLNANDLKGGFIKKFSCSLATGLAYSKKDKCLFVGSFGEIKKIKKEKIIERIKNNLFNDIHFIENFKDSHLLVSSTGTDSLIEIDISKKVPSWTWLATEQGYNKNPLGKIREINRDKDYSKVDTITPEHTTHLNSAIYKDEINILGVLFHQGKLILINKNTNNSKVLLEGLKCPHSIRKISRGYVLSNTLNGEIIILDNNLNIINKIKRDFNWLQDAIELKDGTFLIIDSNNYRICKINSEGEILDTLSFKENPIKLFCFLKINEKDLNNIFN
ncbi:MAG: hypothetical protein ACP5D2_02150 [Candidatus Nanoarchaeia archaeon]